MSTTRAFVGRLTELSVFDPLGDQVGRVRDVVVTFNVARSPYDIECHVVGNEEDSMRLDRTRQMDCLAVATGQVEPWRWLVGCRFSIANRTLRSRIGHAAPAQAGRPRRGTRLSYMLAGFWKL